VRDGQSPASDLAVAIEAVQAAAEVARKARKQPLNPRAKSVAFDLVTEADAQAEEAAATVIKAHRPDDGILGEEGTEQAGARRWLIDAIDGTVAFARELPSWCSAVALEDDQGARVAAVLADDGELHTAQRQSGSVNRVRRAGPLDDAQIATFFRRDRLILPGVRAVAHRLLDRAGLVRQAGPGTLELAWVAQGRIDAWIQPHVDPWDWLPGALLVTEAGGEARVIEAETRWHLAGPADLLDELAGLLR
jgi:myo-inositol-1(or 4)-monophosphatase